MGDPEPESDPLSGPDAATSVGFPKGPAEPEPGAWTLGEDERGCGVCAADGPVALDGDVSAFGLGLGLGVVPPPPAPLPEPPPPPECPPPGDGLGEGLGSALHTSVSVVAGGCGCVVPSMPTPHAHPWTSPSWTVALAAPMDDHVHPLDPFPLQ